MTRESLSPTSLRYLSTTSDLSFSIPTRLRQHIHVPSFHRLTKWCIVENHHEHVGVVELVD